MTGTLTLNKPAPASGKASFASSGNASVQSSINVAQGQSSVTFVVNTAPVTANKSATITASYNNSTVGANLTITPPVVTTPPPGPTAPTGAPTAYFGCIYRENGVAFQAVKFKASGTLSFDGKLYWGPSCSQSQLTDQIGFGAPQPFSGYTYSYWFIHYGNKLNTSGIWTVGGQPSQCIDYSVAPDCN